MMLAQLESVPGEALKNAALIIMAALAALYYVKEIFFGSKKKTEISPQPLTVEIVKALHEQFADKQDFDEHVEHNTERHSQLFNRIDGVERKARQDMEHRFTDLNNERRATLEKLNDQFTFIRENVAAINRELQIRNK
ncbi:MAG: hypothetical protein HOP33_09075 [Verrucomicrobia bacterium]|nr:hypothetical protein [Verrucomicrobiota bacterium]